MNEQVLLGELANKVPVGEFINGEGLNDWFDVDLPVYHCFFDRGCYRDDLFTHFGIIFPESLKRSVIKRRAEHLAGRYCAVRSLERYGIRTGNIGIGRHRSPIWPPGILGSISHSETCAVSVSAPDILISGIGIDVEEVVSAESAARLREKIFTLEDLALLESTCWEERVVFSLVFSIKECFFKAAYPRVGYYFDFDAVTILDIDWRGEGVLFKLNYALNHSFPSGRRFSGMFRFLGDEKIATVVSIDNLSISSHR